MKDEPSQYIFLLVVVVVVVVTVAASFAITVVVLALLINPPLLSLHPKLALSGNLLITTLKFAAYSSSGSLAMWSEAIHSLVDSGNQALLLIGLRDVGRLGDSKHAYGYGKSVYFWSLVSALGTFWLGAGVSMSHSVGALVKGGGSWKETSHFVIRRIRASWKEA